MSAGQRKLSVLVLTFNGREHLETCLPAVAAQRDPGCAWELLLLDNGSSDGTARWVREHHPWVRLVESPANLGFAAGNNRLAALAEGDALVLLNNDTRPEPDWLAALADAAAAAAPDVAAISGRLVDWQGERLDFGYGVRTFDGHAFQLDFRRRLAEARMPSSGEELPFACGANMLVRRRSFLAAGAFSPISRMSISAGDCGPAGSASRPAAKPSCATAPPPPAAASERTFAARCSSATPCSRPTRISTTSSGRSSCRRFC